MIALGCYVPTKRGYRGRQRSRMVLAVSGGYVLYGRGGERHFECRVATFEQWVKRVAAEFNPPVVVSNREPSAQMEIV